MTTMMRKHFYNGIDWYRDESRKLQLSFCRGHSCHVVFVDIIIEQSLVQWIE